LAALDWCIVGGYILIAVAVGFIFSRRAGKSINEYFLSGRNLPWWILGSSMVATTFAADTPLAVTEYVRQDGIWRNWIWWGLAISHVLAAVVFSRLWRRAMVLTDNELIEIRYHGKPAAVLRAFKACYFSTLYNFIVMGWVTAAMSTVLSSFLEIPILWAVLACMAVAMFYSVLSGFWGVVVTDLVQFGVAMVGSIVFAILAASKAGGLGAVLSDPACTSGQTLAFFPS
jgi:SSS family solute:Na+ symporter